MIKFTIKPYDVLFFGSGKPFNAGDVANSIFPPHPTTFAGAICAKIYAYKKIDVSRILRAVYGPFIERNGMLYLPKPSNIYAERKKKRVEKLFVVEPDYGKYKIFDPQNTNIPSNITPTLYKGDAEIEPFEGFVSLKELSEYFKGKTPKRNEILTYDEIFEGEWRVGIKINPGTYSVSGEEDALYRVSFLRLKEDFNFAFWVEFEFEGELQKAGLDNEDKIIEFFEEYPRVLKLGGEMRNARYEVERGSFRDVLKRGLNLHEEDLTVKKDDILQVVFLSYGVFDKIDWGSFVDGFKTHSISLNSYQTVGIKSRHYGTKTQRAFSPGTVMWLKVDDREQKVSVISFIKGKNCKYKLEGEVKGKQNLIGTNLVLLRKWEAK